MKTTTPTPRQGQLLDYLAGGPKPPWTYAHPWRPATIKACEDAGWVRCYTTAAVPGAVGVQMMELTPRGVLARTAPGVDRAAMAATLVEGVLIDVLGGVPKLNAAWARVQEDPAADVVLRAARAQATDLVVRLLAKWFPEDAP